ncbi:MAG: OmpH family outer membrane protein [Chlorobium phaeovibrioides]|nr:OmpH family outer membrane protein [Chlorobium phaeovibrioides]
MNHFSAMMHKSRHILMATVLTILFAVPSLQAAPGAAGRTGVVDFARILQQMPEAKKAESTLNATAEPFKKELQRMNQDLQKSLEAYGQARAGMSQQARELKEKDLNLKAQGMKKFEQEKFGRGGIVQKKEQELITPIRQKLLAAIQSVAQKEGFSLVLDKQAMVYGTADADLTFKVMNQLNIK